MPRIDPLQLLKCLSVLLSPEGGILSRNEVPRLVSLMTKFSKKLVSKCVYVLILKNTETSLVDMFMAENGWSLVQSWLQDAVPTGNWDLVKEILELLLVTPVDVDRLKLNCLPKLIKSLTRKEGLHEVSRLADQIVQKWLMIVKGSASNIAAPVLTPVAVTNVDASVVAENSKPSEPVEKPSEMKLELPEATKEEIKEKMDENAEAIKTDSFYKLTVKDGKQVIRKLSSEKENEKDKTDKKNEKEKSSKSSSSSRSKSSSSSRDKDRNKSSSRSSSSSSKSSSSRDKSRDKDQDRKDRDQDRKDKDKDRRDKDRKSSSSKSSSKSSSSTSSSRDKKDSREKSKDPKENQVEKDKDTLEKLKPKTLKLGRIPKKSDDKSKENKSDDKPKEIKSDDKPKENKSDVELKKPSFSILNRKTTGEERGKTVKVFNSKMRSTGLEEIAKPPPPRSSKKPTPSIQLPTIPPKRPSPPREPSPMVPPEKKIKIDKIDKPDRPGAIKLIAPKPKPAFLQESDMFSDALTAAAPKKDAKKRKRRLSATKDAPGSPTSAQEEPSGGEASTPSSPTPSSPTTLKNIAPINFYQDTLSEQSEKNEVEKEDEDGEDNINDNNPRSPKDDDDDDATPEDSPTADISIQMDNEPMPPPPKQIKLALAPGELKGILVHEKKSSPKRSIQWKADKFLVETRYFELDETERINVTKTFTDMAKMDIDGEREAMINSRISSEDKMAPAIQWYAPFLCEDVKVLAAPGAKSLEKDIQFAREKAVPAAEYFNKRMIPDSPKEPESEVHQMRDPVIIPLEDPEGHVIDLENRPWPEPKGIDPQIEIKQQQQQQMPPMFSNNIPFNTNFNNMPPGGVPFVGVPQRFPGPPGPHGPMMGPANFIPPNMMHNNMGVPPMNQQDMMNGGPMNPAMFVPGPEGFMGVPNEQQFPIPPFNGGPQGPMFGPNNFNHQRGGNSGNRGGGFRRGGGGGGGGGGGWVQVNGPRPWKRGGNSGPHRGSNRMCKNIQNHGYCRNLDTCPFRH